MEGEIVHIDHFGNILTNIPLDLVSSVRTGEHLAVTIRGRTETLPFRTTYADGQQDRLICLISSNEEFEVACVQGNAADYFTAQVGDRLVLRY
jgi:S-adenosylmethionine hydrolase